MCLKILFTGALGDVDRVDCVGTHVGENANQFDPIVTTNGAAVKVTLDVESQDLDKLTPDQRAAIRENLNTLGFAADDWSMD